MRVTLTVLCLLLACLRSSAQAHCPEVKVLERVAVPAGRLLLADLLNAETCPGLRKPAGQVELGAAPAWGTQRVISAGQVLAALQQVPEWRSIRLQAEIEIPDRVTVIRAGGQQSCREVLAAVSSFVNRRYITSADDLELNMSCAAVPALPESTVLQVARSAWNPALQRWEFSLRCAHRQDCVPFLVWTRRVNSAGTNSRRAANAAETRASRPRSTGIAEEASVKDLLVRRGQTATLSWEEAGIRAVLPVTCLEAGGKGEKVRVRLRNGSRVFLAEVIGAGQLRRVRA